MDQLETAGVTVCISYGCSDVALHRCIVAGRALKGLQSSPSIEYVMWFDDDMVATPSHVAFLRAALRSTSHADLGAVTGIYCKRNNPSQVTIRPYHGKKSRDSYVIADMPDPQESRIVPFESHPVLCGMGCLMMTRATFERHCAASPQFETHTASGEFLPAIDASGVVTDEEGKLGWISEDQVYCTGLWQYCEGVWTTPIAFGHICEVAVFPKPDAEWLETQGATS